MKIFIVHIVIAGIISWFLTNELREEPTAVSLSFFFILIFTLLWPLTYPVNRKYFKKLPRLINLISFFVKELVIANLMVAYDVVTPTTHMRPCIVALPLDARTDLEITILANMISLTPGTLSLDLSEDRKYLFVHAIYFKKVTSEDIKRDIKNGFEKKLLEVMR